MYGTSPCRYRDVKSGRNFYPLFIAKLSLTEVQGQPLLYEPFSVSLQRCFTFTAWCLMILSTKFLKGRLHSQPPSSTDSPLILLLVYTEFDVTGIGWWKGRSVYEEFGKRSAMKWLWRHEMFSQTTIMQHVTFQNWLVMRFYGPLLSSTITVDGLCEYMLGDRRWANVLLCYIARPVDSSVLWVLLIIKRSGSSVSEMCKYLILKMF